MGSTGGGQFGQNGQKLRENYKIGILGSNSGKEMGGSANFLPRLPTGETLDYPFFILQIIKTWIKKKTEFLPPPSSVYSPVLKNEF